MSLDVSLYEKLDSDSSKLTTEHTIIIHENYADWLRWNNYKTFQEWYPENNIIEVYECNITHNLNKMAMAAGIYEALWRPYQLIEGYNIPEGDYAAENEFEQNNIVLAKDIIPILEEGLEKLKSNPDQFKEFNSPNGWGTYGHFIPFIMGYLESCKEYPNAIIKTSR